MKWNDRLTKTERRHLRESGCLTLAAFVRTVEAQKATRRANNDNPALEPCWECRRIAQKLNLEV